MAEQPATSASTNRWSAKVTRESNALSLEKGVFTWKDPKAIAQSLKDSAEASARQGRSVRRCQCLSSISIEQAKIWIGNNYKFWSWQNKRYGIYMGNHG